MRIALSHLDIVSATDMPDEFSRNLSQFIVGTKQTVAKEIKDSGKKVEEGKFPMPFKMYCLF